jgi:hypothetical protein
MDCLIDDTIQSFTRKGKTAEAIRKYIIKHYNITMDVASIKERLKKLNLYIKPDPS